MNSLFLILFLSSFFSRLVNEPKFQTQIIDENVAIGYGLALGDVDGDGKTDILLADKKQFVWYRNGDWKRFTMVDNLTASDNVCIAARDIDGDGKVEVAVGAQWNPSETSDSAKSGSVHFLIRPNDPTKSWTPVKLYHEPTIHRMRWVKADENKFHLIVLPLHGVGNKNGEGEPVNVLAYEIPKDPKMPWKHWSIDHSMHLTHNFDVVPNGKRELLYIGGKEGIKIMSFEKGRWSPIGNGEWFVQKESFGEVRVAAGNQNFVVGIQPMHGNELTVYSGKENFKRTVLTAALNQGHALATGDLLGQGRDQIVVGWREPDAHKKTGIKIFVSEDATNQWTDFWIDDSGMACEDLQLADLDGDGKKEIIAAGRATHNLKIYWNKN
ncbi:MAG TPA: VCBS repeat-containing protein [Chryseolinea sp.]|nr:VCBS repeat-containing protein [Chryseolinea sp.]